MGYPFSRFFGLKSQTAAEAAIAVCTGKDENNDFLNGYLGELSEKNQTLQAAVAKSRRGELTEEGESLDEGFNRAMTDYRQMISMKSGIAKLAAESDASKELFNGLIRHGKTIEQLPKAEQITATDNYLSEFPVESALYDTAGVRVLIDDVVTFHNSLKVVEAEKKNISVGESDIPSIGEASKEVNPLVAKIYRHIEDFAYLNPLYKTILAELDEEIAPIAAQIKAEKTRAGNEVTE